jgi:UDPglucose 6-dehydrogenase
VHFICVGTPQQAGCYRADLSALDACIGTLAPLLDRTCLVVGKSTVPVGTAVRLAGQLTQPAPAGRTAELAWNPEFLREGPAVHDTLRPDRIVIGVCSARAEQMLREVYAEPLAAGVPLVVTDLATSELVKVAANAFLATKISFINAMTELCEAAQADVVHLAEALGHNPRTGHRGLRPGLGFGGGCLPRTSARSWPGPGSSGPRMPCASWRTWTRSTRGAAPGWCRWPATCSAGQWPGGPWACSAPHSSRIPTTSGIPRCWR